MKFTPSVGEENKRFIREGVRYVCDTFSCRASGSAGERDAADYMAGVLKGISDEVTVNEVSFRPGAYTGSLTLSALLMVFSSVLFYFCAAVEGTSFLLTCAVFSFLSIAIFVYGFVFSKKFADFLFPRGRGKNVCAVRRSLGAPQKRVILCANLDSPPEWRFSLALGGKPVNVFFVLYSVCLAVVFVIILCYLVAGAPRYSDKWAEIKALQLLSNLAFVPAVFFFGKRKGIGGAAHNVSGIFAAAGVFRELSDSSFHYNDTELVCLLTCGKNAGQRGAQAYVDANRKALKKVKTSVIVFESLCNAAEMTLSAADECGLVRYSPALEEKAVYAMSAAGVSPAKRTFKAGSTDALPFLHAGIDAVTIRAAAKRSPLFFPNRFDSARAINADCIEKTVQTAIELINTI